MAIKVSIKQVQPQKIPVKITSGTGGLLQVEHDDTLVGLGTTAAPLGVNPEYTKKLTDKIGTVADALANETTNREQGDAEINKAISALNSGLQAESNARANADIILQGNIDSEISERASEDAKLTADIAKNSSAISDEATARNQADAALQDSITKETTTRSNADKALQGGIDAEATARTEADTALQTSITKNAGDITTLRNDVDGLGDQVSDIEGKIPGDASTSNQLATKADVTGLETSLAKVAKTGSYNDLGDKPTIGNAVLTITRNNESAGSFAANATENQTINIAVPVSAGDVNALPDTTKYGASVSLTMDSTTYKVSASLKDQNGDVLGAVQTIDLPLESVVVSGTYDTATKEVVLTLQDGSEIRFSVADLVDGLQTEITESNKLSADLVDDSTTVNKFVTSSEKATWNGKQDAISDLATIRAGASKGATAVQPADLATVATSGSYNDLSDKPAIPAAQVNSDWNATSGVAQILNKPTLGTAASKDATDFATAAQGAKADTAVQPAAIADMETKTNAAATYQPKGDYATKTELATGLATKADTTTVNTELAKKQDTLVSGTNIKTVNGESLLGSGDVKIDAGGAMPVGAIFTTPRTGTIQGAVEANGSPYNIADYNGEGSIGALLMAGNIAYVSKAEFQTQVTNTGACDSFGWDGASDTTFLVPKLNPWHVGKSAPVIGNGTAFELTGINGNVSGPNALQPVQGHPAIQQNTGVKVGLTTDPTKSGMIADLSETTNLRVMVQLATGATDQALETCTSVLADVAGLKDMSNITATGKNTVVGWGMPDYSAVVSMTSGSSAPKNGWAVAYGANANVTYSVNGVSVAQGNSYVPHWSGNWNLQIMVSAGDVVTGGSWNFIPCKGAN